MNGTEIQRYRNEDIQLGKKRKNDFAVTSEEKERKKQKREVESENDEDNSITTREEQEGVGGGFKCPDPNCAMFYVTQGYLERHIATGKHFYGSSNVSHTSKRKTLKKSRKPWTPLLERSSKATTKDTIIKGVQQIEEGINAERDKNAKEHEQSKIEINSKHFQRGFAMKTVAKRRKRSIKQLRFPEFWIRLGEGAVIRHIMIDDDR